MGRALSAIIAIAVVGFGPPALAQDNADEARTAFEAGQAAYDAGRFEEALEHFERAYELTNEPDVLFNVATVHDRLRHDREALDAYRRYLEARPDVEGRANIEGRIAALEVSLAREEATPEPEPEPQPAPVPRSIDPAPWIVAGVGGALIAGGVVLIVFAQLDSDTVANGTRWSEIRRAYDRVPILSGVGFGSLGLGAAMLLAGVIWGVVSGGSTEVAIGPGSVLVRGTF